MTNTADLMARMLTCAARITEVEIATKSDNEMRSILPVTVTKDACSLLIEAAAELEKLTPVAPLGEPMELIEGLKPESAIPDAPIAQWYDPMTTITVSDNAVIEKQCPRCGDHSTKTAYVRTRELECPACGHRWKWRVSRVRQR